MIAYVHFTEETRDKRFTILIKGEPEQIGEHVRDVVQRAISNGSKRLTLDIVHPADVYNVDKGSYGE